jgi:peptidoglycan hydrolase CwlO-like protein
LSNSTDEVPALKVLVQQLSTQVEALSTNSSKLETEGQGLRSELASVFAELAAVREELAVKAAALTAAQEEAENARAALVSPRDAHAAEQSAAAVETDKRAQLCSRLLSELEAAQHALVGAASATLYTHVIPCCVHTAPNYYEQVPALVLLSECKMRASCKCLPLCTGADSYAL